MGVMAAQGLYPAVPEGSGEGNTVAQGTKEPKEGLAIAIPKSPELHGEHMTSHLREFAVPPSQREESFRRLEDAGGSTDPSYF